MSEKFFKISRRRKGRKIAALFFLFVIFLPALAFASYSIYFYNRVYARNIIGEYDFGAKSRIELETELVRLSKDFNSGEIVLRYYPEEKRFIIRPAEIGLHFDLPATSRKIWESGRGQKIGESILMQLRSIFLPTEHRLVFSYNEDALNSKIKNIAKEIDKPEKDFSFIFNEGEFELLTDRQPGTRINQEKIISTIKSRIAQLQREEIIFVSESYEPEVSEAKAIDRLAEVNRIFRAGDLTVFYEEKEFKYDAEMIGGTLKAKAHNDDLEIIFDEKRLEAFVKSIAAAINVLPQNAKLKVAENAAIVFEASRDGKTVDEEGTIGHIKEALLVRAGSDSRADSLQRVEAVVAVKKPEIGETEINNLGVKELVATASTEFRGSPSNRVHNIQTGAAALNGVLLKPGENFSTLAKLGEISDKTGYLPELVIKESQTVPEFGGGLCQVSTTLFRAALNAGMKILERKNHKYRVGYYEPPVGMDATIYDPSPDFKFENNYTSYILIQSKVEGTKITFDFYGSKDSRSVEIGQPEIWDVVYPGERINIETDTLAPGEEKQLEKPHPGASAKFHYKVARGEEILQETDFFSKYVSWPEKWLVGKQALVEQPPQ